MEFLRNLLKDQPYVALCYMTGVLPTRRKNDIPFIVELKKDVLSEVAINQIIEKEYVEKFKRENEGKKVLAVAICYDSKSKSHSCKIEDI